MRTARRASTVEVPSFLRQLVRETEKMVTFFFKGGQAERGADDGSDSEDDPDDVDEIPSPYLERPILQKHTAEGGSKWGISYALANMQGWRAQMEDAHTCMPEMANELPNWSYFAVFDGHAGNIVAQYCSTHLLKHILRTGGITAEENVEQVKESITNGFLDIDQHMHNLARSNGSDRSGSTAAAVMISPRNIYFINCGDSRTFLCRDGQVVFYTEDHKPCNPREKERIQNAGGSVMLQRVNGSLAVSRALGDFTFKEVEWRTQTEQLVSPEPEVYHLERSTSDEFLVVACDGVWDAISNEELCAFVRNRLSVCDDLRDVCSQVIDLCLYKGSLDNMSIIIICFSGAPQVTHEALQQEAELEQLLDLKVEEIFQVIRSKNEEPDLLHVMKFLATENILGLPPGGGITSKRDCIITAYQKYSAALRTLEPMLDGTVAIKLQKIIMILMMTLPGTPIIRYGDELSQMPKNLYHSSLSTALFNSLCHICSHEEALLYSNFSLLPFNITSPSTDSFNSTFTPPLTFLHSWECVHLLVAFNFGQESQPLDNNGFLGLPKTGKFLTSTDLN